ncbi:UNVERIFIED_CONTAM: hypothetical protein Slati_1768100 [Sesamum latifolium]|uniref:Uncharacterized protein n=1 Tax=Sesamum latifolium TaxID=2727402 RepID=A0AAW2X172_9LAMI
MRFKMDSMDSNKIWILIDPPKGLDQSGAKRKFGTNGEATTFKAVFVAVFVAKGYTQRPWTTTVPSLRLLSYHRTPSSRRTSQASSYA